MYINRDTQRLLDIGFEKLVAERRGRSNFHPGVKRKKHKAACLLHHLKERGVNVMLLTPPWDEQQQEATLECGSHNSANEYSNFLHEELLDFVKKGFWLVLPYQELKKYK
jgi:hypothetical protein